MDFEILDDEGPIDQHRNNIMRRLNQSLFQIITEIGCEDVVVQLAVVDTFIGVKKLLLLQESES